MPHCWKSHVTAHLYLSHISKSLLSAYADVSSWARGLNFGQDFIYLQTLFMQAVNALGDCVDTQAY